MSRGEADTESEAWSSLWVVSTEPNAGLKLTKREIMIWAEVGRLTDWATQAPLECNIEKKTELVFIDLKIKQINK